MLWQRHSGAGLTIARRYRDLAEPDDVVAEAFARIFSAIKRGNGPTGAFRPYLAVTIANVAKRWASQRRTENSDDLEFIAGTETTEQTDREIDGELAIAAFKQLPERWQQVLWHSEVEGLGVSEIAPIIGLNANATAALSHRARGALRVAFVELHLKDAGAAAACSTARRCMAGKASGKVSARSAAALAGHLATCADCRRIELDVRRLLPGLAVALLPLLLGGAFIPAVPAATTAAAASAPIAIAASAKAAIPFAIVPMLAAAAAVVIVAAVGTSAPAVQHTDATVSHVETVTAPSFTSQQPFELPDRSPVIPPPPETPSGSSTVPAPTDVPDPIAPIEPPVVVPVDPPVDPPIDPPVALASPTVSTTPDANIQPGAAMDGTGTPGAIVTIDDGRGIPITTALVDGAGAWSAILSPLSTSISSIEVRQSDDTHPSSEPLVLTGFAPLTGAPYREALESDYLRIGGIPGATIRVLDETHDCGAHCEDPITTDLAIPEGTPAMYKVLTDWDVPHLITVTYVDQYGLSESSQSFEWVP